MALDLRGYGESDKPGRVEDYRLDTLVEDVHQLIPALGTGWGWGAGCPGGGGDGDRDRDGGGNGIIRYATYIYTSIMFHK